MSNLQSHITSSAYSATARNSSGATHKTLTNLKRKSASLLRSASARVTATASVQGHLARLGVPANSSKNRGQRLWPRKLNFRSRAWIKSAKNNMKKKVPAFPNIPQMPALRRMVDMPKIRKILKLPKLLGPQHSKMPHFPKIPQVQMPKFLKKKTQRDQTLGAQQRPLTQLPKQASLSTPFPALPVPEIYTQTALTQEEEWLPSQGLILLPPLSAQSTPQFTIVNQDGQLVPRMYIHRSQSFEGRPRFRALVRPGYPSPSPDFLNPRPSTSPPGNKLLNYLRRAGV